MKTIAFSAPFLFALLASASLDNLVDSRAVNPDLRRFLPRGDHVIPQACSKRKHAPADVKYIPATTRYESSPTSSAVVEDDTDEEEKFETRASSASSSTETGASSSSVSSSASESSASSVDNKTTKEPVSEDDEGDSVSSSRSSASAASTAAAGGNDAIVVNTVPSPVTPNNGAAGAAVAAVTSNEAIVVVSVPTPVPGLANKTYGNAAVKVNAKRSSHNSHSRPNSHHEVFSDIDVDVVHSSTTVIILDDYVDFDWSDWKQSVCLLDTGDKDGWDERFGCTTWGSFDGKSAFHADAHPCLQQHFADAMITYAKRNGGNQRKSWIKQILKYRRHPRKVIKTLGIYPSTPYCMERPLNKELRGVWNAQVKGVDYGIYGGPKYDLKAFGEEGTCPLGLRADSESCGCVHDPDFRWEDKPSYSPELQDCLQTCSGRYNPFSKKW